MTIKKLMMAAGAIDGPQVIAPSSNDWDYTFNTSNDWAVAGNSLGDHTDGGYFAATNSSTSGLSSLITLDGDFEIEWTMADPNQAAFGVHAIDEDDSRAGSGVDACNMAAMTNSFYYRDETTDFYIGSSAQSDTMTFGDGSVIKIERVSGTIKVYDDGVVVHTYGTTYSGVMRFAAGTPGSPIEANFDNFKITDTEKVQRDGFFNEGTSALSDWGEIHGSSRHYGRKLKATRTGTVSTVLLHMASVTTSFNSNCKIYSDDGTSPASIIGSASDTVSIASSGEKTYTFDSLPAVVKGTSYWVIFSDISGGSGRSAMTGLARSGLPSNQNGAGRNGTITSIIANEVTSAIKMELVYEATGEPTPDHDTLLLIHSNTSDGSTTFADSSQFGRTITVAGDAQHDTAQKKFGSSSILFDGTLDELTVPDSTDWHFGGGNAFTIDFWIYTTTGARGLMSHNTSDPASNWDMYVATGGQIYFTCKNGTSLQGSTAINNGAWHHVAIVWSGNNWNLYIDGTSDASATDSSWGADVATTLRIGKAYASGSNHFIGHLDEIRISKVARWEPGVNFTPPTSAYP